MRLIQFEVDEIYHVYNRGVDKRDIFSCHEDYRRFQDGMWIFNDVTVRDQSPFVDRRKTNGGEEHGVEVLSFAMMPNHFHLLLREKTQDGISTFMQRLGLGYTHYYNRTQGRTGRLFESTFKAKHIDTDAYLEHITRYIHLNPLDLFGVDWKYTPISNKKILEPLFMYPWSSLYYYCQKKQTPFFDPSLLNQLFSSPQEHVDYLLQYQTIEDIDAETR